MLKPDCLERGLVNDVLAYLQEITEMEPEQPLKVRGMKKMRMTDELLERHYRNVDDEILDELQDYFGTRDGSGYEIVPMVVHGTDAVERVRELVVDPIDPDGYTFLPENSASGTIRGDIVTPGTPLYADPAEWPHYYEDLADEQGATLYNLVHAAENTESAAAEIDRFFGEAFPDTCSAVYEDSN